MKKKHLFLLLGLLSLLVAGYYSQVWTKKDHRNNEPTQVEHEEHEGHKH